MLCSKDPKEEAFVIKEVRYYDSMEHSSSLFIIELHYRNRAGIFQNTGIAYGRRRVLGIEITVVSVVKEVVEICQTYEVP